MQHFTIPALLIITAVVLLAIRDFERALRSGQTLAQRLADGYRGSLTIFTTTWVAIGSVLGLHLDAVAALIGDPALESVGDLIKTWIPQKYLPLLTLAGAGLTIWSRLRTLGKG
jgi:hypothetical protein